VLPSFSAKVQDSKEALETPRAARPAHEARFRRLPYGLSNLFFLEPDRFYDSRVDEVFPFLHTLAPRCSRAF
jgi:hypothetical protein